jgi:hypothetical protein
MEPVMDAAERLVLVRLFVDLVKVVYGGHLPDEELLRADLLYVGAGVVLGQLQNRPFTAAKLADYLRLPRPTVIRKLEALEQLQLATRQGSHWYFRVEHLNAPGVLAVSRRARQLIVETGRELSEMDTKVLDRA